MRVDRPFELCGVLFRRRDDQRKQAEERRDDAGHDADAQAAAVANGALPGFGKREIGSPRVLEILKAALETPTAAHPKT